MARRTRSTEKGPLWHGYRRPVWRDKIFWLAFGTSIAGLLVQDALGKVGGDSTDWAVLGLEVVFTFAVVFALIGVVAGTVRGFGEGWRQADKAAPTAPTRRSTSRPAAATPETDPAAPAEVTVEVTVEPELAPQTEPDPVPELAPQGEPVAAVSEPSRPVSGPTDRPRAGVEIERQARRLGRAIGAGRRTYKKPDDS